MMHFGVRDGLHFTLRWRDDYGTPGPIGATWGDLCLWVGGSVIWGTLTDELAIKPITWSWIELLEFFASAWPYLREEEGYPIDFGHYRNQPDHPGQFRSAVESRWAALEQSEVYREDRLMRDFLQVHDLAQGLQGAYPPPLILLREGASMIAAADDQYWRLPLRETLESLEALGDALYQRILDLDDARSQLARDRWKNRNRIDNSARFAILSGWDDEWVTKALPPANESELLAEYAIAARMVGRRLAPLQARKVLEAIHDLPLSARPPLDRLWNVFRERAANLAGQVPAQQGYALALLLRECLDIAVDTAVSPEVLLEGWGVAIHEFPLPDTLIDAVAVWGPNHGPAILVNPEGPRMVTPTGRQATLAHEICHLLVDYGAALPVVEVLGGLVPKVVEQRANAFAAEFLLPRAAATKQVSKIMAGVADSASRKLALRKAVDHLSRRYGTSHEMTAWQIKNSNALSPVEHVWLQQYLKSIYEPFNHED